MCTKIRSAREQNSDFEENIFVILFATCNSMNFVQLYLKLIYTGREAKCNDAVTTPLKRSLPFHM